MNDSMADLRTQLQSMRRRTMIWMGSSSSEEGGDFQFEAISAQVRSGVRYTLFATVAGFLFLMALVAQSVEVTYPTHHSTSSTAATEAGSVSADSADGNEGGNSKSESLPKVASHTGYLNFLLAFCFVIGLCSCLAVFRISRAYNLAQHAGGDASGNGTGTRGSAGQRRAEQLIFDLFSGMGRGAGGRMGLGGQRMLNLNNMSTRMLLQGLQRNFTGDDFELLQQLDSPSQQDLGATEEEIGRLPEHVVPAAAGEQNGGAGTGAAAARVAAGDLESGAAAAKVGAGDSSSSRANCNICLGPYEAGETVRTLPCLHQYHQPCIDRWLRSKGTCPVCKHPVTQG